MRLVFPILAKEKAGAKKSAKKAPKKPDKDSPKVSKKPAEAKKSAPKKKPKSDPFEDSGIIIVDDDIEFDQEKVNEERKAYLEEARSQEAFD